MTDQSIKDRLEYLRGEIRAECISWGELHELQGLAEHIEPHDVELLELAGVPEFPEEPRTEWSTAELQEDFEVLGFALGMCVVRRRADGVEGTLEFDHAPRVYRGFKAA
jgi:hypothetical protein